MAGGTDGRRREGRESSLGGDRVLLEESFCRGERRRGWLGGRIGMSETVS